MGAMWMSWKTTTSVIITVLQIQALMSVRTTTVTGVEGQTCSFRCEYPPEQQSNAKFLCCTDDSVSNSQLIMTNTQNQWVREGRFSLYDNTTGAFIIITVDKLVPMDKRTYLCGVDIDSLPDHVSVIQLNVVREPPENLSHYITTKPISPMISRVNSVNKPLLVTAVMCVAAMLFVCLFTLCLLLAVKHRRLGPRHNRQTSADYETMMPRAGPESLDCCTCPECAGLSALSPLPPELCSDFKSKQRESTVTLGVSEYVDVDVSGRQYQHLDLNQLDENVYHSLHGNHGPMDEKPLGVTEQLNC